MAQKYKINYDWVDWWSIPHFIIGYLFGRYNVLDVYQFTALNGGWELFENLVLKKHYDVFNVPFGRKSVLESKGNAICDFFITEAGYGLGMYFRFANRAMIDFLKTYYSYPVTGVEIGAYKGINAENILKKIPIQRLYLVDPYIEYFTPADALNIENPYPESNVQQAKQECYQRMASYRNQVVFIEQDSILATKRVPNQLDFVYIDGNHSYTMVKEDINNWYPKVRSGGVIGGHDYSLPGVKKAVDEFNQKAGLHVYQENEDWWVIKP